MPNYQFRGRRTDNGAAVLGERVAPSKQSLAVALRGERIMPVSIIEKGEAAPKRHTGKVPAKTLALFTRQFSVVIDFGLPLIRCLSIMSEQQEHKGFKQVLDMVREEVEAGATLADSMRRHPGTFDNLFVNMVAAGEAGGILDIILRRLAVFVEKAAKLKRAVLGASIYPAVVIVVAVVVVFVIMLWVIPVFATLFEGLNASLPLPTRIVMGTSNLIAQFIIPIIAIAVLSVVGFRYYYKTDGGRHVVDRTMLALPIMGTVLKKIAIARFSRTLSTLLVSGVPILEGLEITAGTAGNVILEEALLRARREVSEGKTLAEPIKKTAIFPPMVTSIVAVGEQTGELDQMLEKLADYYEEEADAAVASMLALLEPVMIVFLGGIIGTIVVSMYLPIFTLIRELSTR